MEVQEVIRLVLDKYGIPMTFVQERQDFHPEYSLLQHTLTVLDNIAIHNDTDLFLTALFHDIGKIETYKKHRNAYDHAKVSAFIVSEHHDLIEQVGGNLKKIHWLVKNHQWAHNILNNKKSKNDWMIRNTDWWNDLVKFCKADDMLDDSNKDLTQLIGRRAYVTVDKRRKRDILAGKCSFIGINAFTGKKQVIISRTPIDINNFNLVCTYFNFMSGKF